MSGRCADDPSPAFDPSVPGRIHTRAAWWVAEARCGREGGRVVGPDDAGDCKLSLLHTYRLVAGHVTSRAFSALTLLVGRQERSIRPVKIEWRGVCVVICLERGADCLHMVQLMSLHPQTPSSLASFKSRLVLRFWYQLTQVVLFLQAVCTSWHPTNSDIALKD